MKHVFAGTLRRCLAAASPVLFIPLRATANQGAPPAPGACHAAGRPVMPGGDISPPSLRRLNLSDAQRDKVFAILHEQAPAMRDKRKAMHKTAEDLRPTPTRPGRKR